ncbi:S8/S53 family peptidase [Patescibacteria group bacterium]|nr:S8/S53 family peptidase [Patescibacteria group bacterium]
MSSKKSRKTNPDQDLGKQVAELQKQFSKLDSMVKSHQGFLDSITSSSVEPIKQDGDAQELTNEIEISLLNQRSFYDKKLIAKAKTHLPGIKVAILDSGCSPNHDHLPSIHQLHPSLISEDSHGHGTQIAGIIAGSEYGLAPGVQLYVANVTNQSIPGKKPKLSLDKVKDAVRAAIVLGVDFINMSLGGFGRSMYDKELEGLLLKASIKGIVVIVAAGNDGTTKVQNVAFPATCGCVIRVGSHTLKGASSPLTPIGEIDIAALGTDVWAPTIGGKLHFKRQSGTSFAAAFVTGLCCLLKGYAAANGFAELLSSTHIYKHVFRKLCLNLRDDAALGAGMIQLKHIAADHTYFEALLKEAV